MVYVCIHEYVCMHKCMYVFIFVHIDTYIYRYTYIYEYIYTHMYIYQYIYIYVHVCIIYMYVYIYMYIYPPDPMNYVRVFKGCHLPYGCWYWSGTKHFRLIILIRWQSTTQLCSEIQPAPHNLVRKIRSWSIFLADKDF